MLDLPEKNAGSLAPSKAGPPPARKKTKSQKRKLYELHTWLGFHLALLMSVVLLTGTIAVIANEIDWLIQHDMRVTPDGEKVSWGVMEKAVHEAAPDHMLTWLAAGEGDSFAYRATMVRPDGKRYYLHVNQWTGEVTGTTYALTVQRFFRDLHRYLFMPNIIGLPIVCSLAFVLIISLYTGLKTAGRLTTAALRLRTGKGARIMVGDFHKAAGVWSIWFFVIITATSIWYLAEFGAAIAGQRFEPPRPGLTQERVAELGDVMRVLPADELVAKATEAFPGWTPDSIMYPNRPSQAVTILGRSGDILVRSRANRVFLDPVDGSIIKVQKSNEIGVVAYLNEIADPLHFGSFGHLPTKLIWFVFGAAMTALSFTGVWLTYKRLKKTLISRAQIATMPVLLGAVIFGSLYVDRYTGSEENGVLVADAAQDFDNVSVRSAWRKGEKSGKHLVEVNIRHPDGRPIVRAVNVVGADGEMHALRFRTFASRTVLKGAAPPGAVAENGPLNIEIEMASGARLTKTIEKP